MIRFTTTTTEENGKTKKTSHVYELSKRPRVEVHMILPLSCNLLNRGEDGLAKTILQGGRQRLRISSQCQKFAIRQEFKNQDTVRTKRVLVKIMDDLKTRLAGEDIDEKGFEKLRLFVRNFLSASSKEDNGNRTEDSLILNELHQISFHEIDTITDFVGQHWKDIANGEEKSTDGSDKKEDEKKNKDKADKLKIQLKNELCSALMGCKLTDEVALFGRMDTNHVIRECESAVGMNHLVSVDEFNGDVDFFTAKDTMEFDFDNNEEKKWDSKGAGMVGEKDVSANTMYGYTVVDIATLIENLSVGRDVSKDKDQKEIKEKAFKLVKWYIDAYRNVRPVAHQHDIACYDRPSHVYITLGDRTMNISYGNLYHKAIYKEDVANAAAEKLLKEVLSEEDNNQEYIGRWWISRDKEELTDDMKKNLKDKIMFEPEGEKLTIRENYEEQIRKIIDGIEFNEK